MASKFDCDNWQVISHGLTCAPTTFTSGRRINGYKQVRGLPNGYWRGPVSMNPIRRLSMVDYRGWLAGLQGSSGEFDLCICDPYALKGEGKTTEEWLELLGFDVDALCGPVDGKYGLPFSDGTCFADGTGFDFMVDYEQAAVATAAAQGATSIELNGAAAFLRCGNYFSTSDNYLHIITSEPTGSTITFEPPLRRALAAGEAIETQDPKVRVRLASDTEGTATQNYGRYTNAITINVEEVLTR